MKILLVEDEPLILMDIELQLRDAGQEVVSVRNADRAIVVLADRLIDLVLTDIDMPGSMDGLMLAEAIRNSWPSVKIVVMSGKRRPAGEDLPSRARFLEKPLHAPDLMNAVCVW